MTKTLKRDHVRTRFCIISDTHSQPPLPSTIFDHAYRQPLPSADVLLHAGDITMVGYLEEYKKMMESLVMADAELKIVIAGNHDITLHDRYYMRDGLNIFHTGVSEDLTAIKELWLGKAAKEAGIVYLEEGTRTFELSNGARFTIYTSPWQPEFCNWAFNYSRDEDRFNPSPRDERFDPFSLTDHRFDPGPSNDRPKAINRVPSWPAVDIMLTHGPPGKVLDKTSNGENAGCEHLLRAVERCRPRLHCFGHIHEGWGAERRKWSDGTSKAIELDGKKIVENRSAYLNLTKKGQSPLIFGEETVFVNAAIMTVTYKPYNAPWVVDLELPLSEKAGKTEGVD